MKWYLIYIITAFPTLLLAIYDFTKNGLNFKHYKTYLLLCVVVGSFINVIYVPINHYETEKENKNREKLLDSIKKTNEAIRNQNTLLKSQVSILNDGFQTYRKQIMKLSINIRTEFIAKTDVDFTSRSSIPSPSTIYAIANVTGNPADIRFQTHDNSYSYIQTSKAKNHSTYRFEVSSEVIDGKFPIGSNLDIFKNVSTFFIYIPTFKEFFRDNALLRNVIITKTELILTINGKRTTPIRDIQPLNARISPCHYQNQDGWICYNVNAVKNFYDVFDLSRF